ncbi:hypothetical protein CCP3SC1_1000012 [Gammaproteobacteria bacterium]
MTVDDPTTNVKVDAPLPPAMEVGLKVAVVPAGNPETESATFELKPPDGVTVIAIVPLAPFATESEVGEIERDIFTAACAVLKYPISTKTNRPFNIH